MHEAALVILATSGRRGWEEALATLAGEYPSRWSDAATEADLDLAALAGDSAGDEL